jgi:hypothetical protein
MNYPTLEELAATREAIERDGPAPDVTNHLSALIVKNDSMRSIALSFSELKAGGNQFRAIVTAIATGMHYGLRIQELRSRGEGKP